MSSNRAVAYRGAGAGKVEVEDTPYPELVLKDGPGVNPANVGCRVDHGVILKSVSTNICGSDQHMVRGRTTAPEGLPTRASATVLSSLMDVTAEGGAIGIPGLYVTGDPGGIDAAAQVGSLSLSLGTGWAKSLSFTPPVSARSCAAATA